MDKALKVVQLKDTNTDFYSMSRSEVERLQAFEILRQQYINYKMDVQSTLQKVYKVVDHKQG